MQDQWARWVLQSRQDIPDDFYPAFQRERLEKAQRDAKIVEGEVVLDVGTGVGLLAFGAVPLVGEQGKVIFSDISQNLLDHCRSQAEQMGVLDRCQFLRASADDLSALADASVDAVTLKAVLIYVAAKQRAFQEFHRVLKPGGRLYIEEPINRFSHWEPEPLFWGFDATPIQEMVRKVRALYERLQPSETSSMLDFDERDLVRFAEDVGFTKITLELQASINRHITIHPDRRQREWESFWRRAGNPRIPTLEEAVAQALTPEEAEQFVAYLRPKVETGPRVGRSTRAYLWAVK